MSDLRAYQKHASGRTSLVLSDEATRDAMQKSGRWIASTRTLDLGVWQ